MKYKNKHVLKMEDGRNEPIKDLAHASRIILIDKETVGAEDITFGYSKWAPNMSFHKKHAHENAEEIMYILRGTGEAISGNNRYHVKPGSLIYAKEGDTHGLYNTSKELPLQYFVLEFIEHDRSWTEKGLLE